MTANAPILHSQCPSCSGELAATAEEMSRQAEQLQQKMGFFKLSGGTPAKAAAPAARSRPARKPVGPVLNGRK